MSPDVTAEVARVIATRCMVSGGHPWSKASHPGSYENQMFSRLFGGFAPQQVTKAFEDWRGENPKAVPTVDELLARLRGSASRNSGLASPATCKHPQPWGFLETEKGRVAICRLCYSEWLAPNVKTDLEIAAAKATEGIPD